MVAYEVKTTKRPSPVIEPPKLGPLPWAPLDETLTRSVVPVCRSRTKTSGSPLVSPLTRLPPRDSKATKRPSAESAAEGWMSVPPSSGVPFDDTFWHPLQKRLLEEHRIEVPIAIFRDTQLVRISAQLYNDLDGFGRLASALAAIEGDA